MHAVVRARAGRDMVGDGLGRLRGAPRRLQEAPGSIFFALSASTPEGRPLASVDAVNSPGIRPRWRAAICPSCPILHASLPMKQHAHEITKIYNLQIYKSLRNTS